MTITMGMYGTSYVANIMGRYGGSHMTITMGMFGCPFIAIMMGIFGG